MRSKKSPKADQAESLLSSFPDTSVAVLAKKARISEGVFYRVIKRNPSLARSGPWPDWEELHKNRPIPPSYKEEVAHGCTPFGSDTNVPSRHEQKEEKVREAVSDRKPRLAEAFSKPNPGLAGVLEENRIRETEFWNSGSQWNISKRTNDRENSRVSLRFQEEVSLEKHLRSAGFTLPFRRYDPDPADSTLWDGPAAKISSSRYDLSGNPDTTKRNFRIISFAALREETVDAGIKGRKLAENEELYTVVEEQAAYLNEDGSWTLRSVPDPDDYV